MSRNERLEGMAWAEGEQTESSSTVKMILAMVLAFLLGFLVLSPVIMGIYWEIFLPK